MAIEEMRLVVLSTSKDEVYPLIESVNDTPYFHPELSKTIINEGNGGLEYPAEMTYEDYLKRIDVIIHDLNLELDESYDRPYSHQEIEDAILEAESQYNILHHMDRSENLDQDDKLALKALKQYSIENTQNGFITLKFGRIPIDSYSKIILHNDETFVFTSLHKTKDYVWIAYIALNEESDHLEKIFDSLYFEPIAIPLYSEEAINQACIQVLDHVYGYVLHMALKEVYLQYICIFEERLTITGFVTTKHLEDLRKQSHPKVKVQDFPPDTESGLSAPTLLRNGLFSKPFEMFIKMYGLPSYDGFDPTFYFAITYTLLFGMMFGDLGQGLVLVLGGQYLYKKKDMALGAIAVRLGLSSMIFGTIFGSFFGNETILLPFLSPVGLPIHVASPDFTMTLLLSAVGLGVMLILSSILLNIYILLRKRNFGKAIFSQNGIAGFSLYGFVMCGLALQMLFKIDLFNPLTMIVFIGVPLICILMIEPLSHMLEKRSLSPHSGWGAYLVEGIFELIEVVLSFVTNTMSFLRVGGFVLSHAGMMIVVMTLNEMSGQYGILVMILGNALVIALEGLIVGIQTLRLEYYEMFSRYYEGGGKEFKSVYKEKTL